MSGVQTVYRSGSRYYIHPTTEALAPSVTSVLNMEAKPFLQGWSAKMAAECAVEDLEVVQRIADRDRQAAVDFLKNAAKRYTKVRADVGSLVHDVWELELRGEHQRRVHPDVEPYMPAIRAFLDHYQPELLFAEDVAWSHGSGPDTTYAGSFDFMVRINGKVVLGDLKTSKDVYPSVAKQLAAYAHADELITSDLVSQPFPKVDRGAVLHLTPAKSEFRPVEIGDGEFAKFMNHRESFKHSRAGVAGIIGRAAWAYSDGTVTGTARRS
ncbi:hypothetical protein [Kitasatospora purpeofusca]|uniref:hypothetical protein n=1 Tax=Kitasatospora purpeofusca TaxID=67352 RepID=UPI00369490CC